MSVCFLSVFVNVLTNIRRIFNVVGIGVTLYFVILSRGGAVSVRGKWQSVQPYSMYLIS